MGVRTSANVAMLVTLERRATYQQRRDFKATAKTMLLRKQHEGGACVAPPS
jgi:hypothetical protein